MSNAYFLFICFGQKLILNSSLTHSLGLWLRFNNKRINLFIFPYFLNKNMSNCKKFNSGSYCVCGRHLSGNINIDGFISAKGTKS